MRRGIRTVASVIITSVFIPAPNQRPPSDLPRRPPPCVLLLLRSGATRQRSKRRRRGAAQPLLLRPPVPGPAPAVAAAVTQRRKQGPHCSPSPAWHHRSPAAAASAAVDRELGEPLARQTARQRAAPPPSPALRPEATQTSTPPAATALRPQPRERPQTTPIAAATAVTATAACQRCASDAARVGATKKVPTPAPAGAEGQRQTGQQLPGSCPAAAAPAGALRSRNQGTTTRTGSQEATSQTSNSRCNAQTLARAAAGHP